MAARITAQNYEALKGFCCWFWTQQADQFDKLGLPPDDRPDAIVAAFEKQSMAFARQSVRLGVGDIIEQTQGVTGAQLADMDAALRHQMLPTLSQVRLDFWGKIHGIMKRGKVRSEGEYYVLRNVVEAMLPDNERQAWQILADYENRGSGKVGQDG